MPAKQKPPMECRTISQINARDDYGRKTSGNFKLDVYDDSVVLVAYDSNKAIDVPKATFNRLIRWYTGTEKKARSR